MGLNAARTEAARLLARARIEGEIVRLAEAGLPRDEEEAQGVAALVREVAGAPIGGWKIGATSALARRIMKTDRPFAGAVLLSDLHGSGAEIELAPGFRGFECEFAFRLARSLGPRERVLEKDEVRVSVDLVAPAIELVATRLDLDGMGNAILATADWGFNQALVLGHARPLEKRLDLGAVEVRALVDGEERAKGTGEAVMGDPLEALTWLANQGLPLEAGQWVTTGTCTGITPLVGGSEAAARFEGLGEVSFKAR